MTVTILGSGTGVPNLARSACSALVDVAGVRLLLDMGPGTMRRLLETGIMIHEVDYLLLSHFHPDHAGELPSFLFALKSRSLPQRKTPLVIVGGLGLQRHVDALRGVYGKWIELAPEMLQLREMSTDREDGFSNSHFKVTTLPVAHNPESVAFRISAENRTMVYSGDTDVSANLRALAHQADVFICESALPDAMKVDNHLTPSLAGKIATEAGVARLVLTHFYPECENVDIEAQCRQTYSGPLILARDLLKLTI